MAVRSSRRSGLASLKPTGIRSELVPEPLSTKDNNTHSLFAPHDDFIPAHTSELFISQHAIRLRHPAIRPSAPDTSDPHSRVSERDRKQTELLKAP